jgi:hypothetical protein
MMQDCERVLRSGLVLLLTACAIATGCSRRQQQSAQNDEKKPAPVSEVAPKLEPLRQAVPPVVNARPVASVGDCGPKYANGLRGSCINNQPCRGIGVLDEKGKAVCSCYGTAGGCKETERCDAIKKACVPEKEPGFGRAPGD